MEFKWLEKLDIEKLRNKITTQRYKIDNLKL